MNGSYIFSCINERARITSGSIPPVVRWGPPKFCTWGGIALPFCWGRTGNCVPAWLGTCPEICPDMCACTFIFFILHHVSPSYQVPHYSKNTTKLSKSTAYACFVNNLHHPRYIYKILQVPSLYITKWRKIQIKKASKQYILAWTIALLKYIKLPTFHKRNPNQESY